MSTGPSARVTVDQFQVERVARRIGVLPDAVPFDFTGRNYPQVDHPQAVDFFFAAVVQQFGFWEEAVGRYTCPMIAQLEGQALKGSDYLWRAYRRKLDQATDFFAPATHAEITAETLRQVFRADDGSVPLPAFGLHLDQAHAYGRDMLRLGLTPADVVAQAQASPYPLRTLLTILAQVGGYREDPMRKKANLLAQCLSQRPEGFLRPASGETIAPIVDYHLMRSCLRMGLIEVSDPGLKKRLAERRTLSAEDEDVVRSATYTAVKQVVRLSGRSPGAVDWYFFGARQRCPEMTEPECPRCTADPVCLHRKELFQPVRRTTFY